MVAAGTTGFAHHGNFTFDGDTVITLEGVVTEFEFVQRRDGDRIVVNPDWMNAERIIHVGAAFPDPLPESRHGYSVGRFAGSTLVVETRGFSANAIGNAFGVASSPSKRLIERFTLVDDGYALDYSFELTDPVYLAETVRGSYRWDYRPDTVPSGVACDVDAASH